MTKITKHTTDEELFAPILRAKAALAEAAAAPASEFHDSESFSNLVNSVARTEGEAEVNYLLRNALQFDASVEAIERTILQAALRSSDDTYSGRNNDCRRAKRDGLIARAKDLTQFDGIRKIVEAQG